MSWSHSLHALNTVLGGTGPVAEAQFHGVSTDTRTLREGDAFFALRGEQFDGGAFVAQALVSGAAVAVTADADPNCPADRQIVVPDALAALQHFAAWHRGQFAPLVFALTGSCGKTSTKDLVAALMATRFRVLKTEGNLNNEIGCPLSLARIDAETGFAVIEMGANHVGEIARLCALARPAESAITLVAPAHLEGFGSIERVAQAKGEIAAGLPPGGRFYVNVDNPWTRAIGERHPGPTVRWGSHGDVVLRDCRFDEHGEMLVTIDPVGTLRLPLRARAHAMNVTLAVAVALQHGVNEFEGPLREACLRAARFKTCSIGSLEVIDDTYNANPASMAAALEALGEWPARGRRFAALGEMLELGDTAEAAHRDVGTLAAQRGVDRLFARGPHAHAMIAAARAAGLPHADAMDDHAAIARAIHQEARPGDVLLLKGSRGMRMEKVLEALRSLDAGPPP
jgi:UDP-N-acetylmuramoyl-tripeptide--D-alanyl-D-alanine ligase